MDELKFDNSEIIERICKLDYRVLMHLFLCTDPQLRQQDFAETLGILPITVCRELQKNVVSEKRAPAVQELLKNADWNGVFEKIAAIRLMTDIVKMDSSNVQRSIAEGLVQKAINDILAISTFLVRSSASSPYPDEWVNSIGSALRESIKEMEAVAMTGTKRKSQFRLEQQ